MKAFLAIGLAIGALAALAQSQPAPPNSVPAALAILDTRAGQAMTQCDMPRYDRTRRDIADLRDRTRGADRTAAHALLARHPETSQADWGRHCPAIPNVASAIALHRTAMPMIARCDREGLRALRARVLPDLNQARTEYEILRQAEGNNRPVNGAHRRMVLIRLAFLNAVIDQSDPVMAGGAATACRPPPVAPTPPPQPQPVPAAADLCPRTLPAGQSGLLTCRCPAGAHRGDVVGTFHYTSTSSLCGAARHMGLIEREGGTVTIRPGGERYYFVPSTRNDVTSLFGRTHPVSFTFYGHGHEEERRARVPLCHFRYQVYSPEARTRPITCRCLRGQNESAVYGSGPYTEDSSICTAARHAGLWTTDGIVIAHPAPRQSRFTGSSGNGITTSGWNQEMGAFTVSSGE